MPGKSLNQVRPKDPIRHSEGLHGLSQGLLWHGVTGGPWLELGWNCSRKGSDTMVHSKLFSQNPTRWLIVYPKRLHVVPKAAKPQLDLGHIIEVVPVAKNQEGIASIGIWLRWRLYCEKL